MRLEFNTLGPHGGSDASTRVEKWPWMALLSSSLVRYFYLFEICFFTSGFRIHPGRFSHLPRMTVESLQ
jgi:hypothetical protein